MNQATSANTSNISAVAAEGKKFSRVVPITIGDQLCYPKFKCIHLDFPGEEQLKKNLARYRQKELLIHLFKCANNFDASDEELHSEFFGAKQDGIRIVWSTSIACSCNWEVKNFWSDILKIIQIFRNWQISMSSTDHSPFLQKRTSSLCSENA